MGVDTRLLVSDRWELEDIKKVIETRLKTKVEVRSCHKTSMGMFMFCFKIDGEQRTMYVHSNNITPIGTSILLSLGHNKQAVRIMRAIADVLGGFLQEMDCDGNYEFVDGMFSESNGLSYFYKYAVLENEMKDENDLVGLNESIHKWLKKVSSTDRERMRLFDVKD